MDKNKSLYMSGGCPFNKFGPCITGKCMFWLDADDAKRIYKLRQDDFKELSGRVEDQCALWLTFLSAQEDLADRGDVSVMTAQSPRDAKHAASPVALLCDMLHRHEQILLEIQQRLAVDK